MAGKDPLAGRPGLLALRGLQSRLQDRINPVGIAAPKRSAPQRLHRDHWHRNGAQPYRPKQVADGVLPDVVQQEEGMSAHQLHRALGVDLQGRVVPLPPHPRGHVRQFILRLEQGTARLRAAKLWKPTRLLFGQAENPTPGKSRKGRPFTKGGRSGPAGKRAVVALVERRGRVRALPPAVADGPSVAAIVRENIAREAHLDDG